jgi:integrase
MPAYKDKEIKKWYASFKYNDLNGGRHTKKKRGFNNKSEALEFEREFLVKNSNSSQYDINFKDLCNDYMISKKSRMKPRSIYDISMLIDKHIIPYYGNLSVKRLNMNDIQKWQENLLKCNYSNAYLVSIQSKLSSILNYAIRKKIINTNLIQILGFVKQNQPKKEMKFYNFDDYKKFRSVLPEDDFKTIFDVLYFTGVRIGELQALTYGDFRKKDKLLFVHSNYDYKNHIFNQTTKTGENRYVILNDTVFNELVNKQLEFKQYSDYDNDKLIFGYITPTSRRTIENRKNKAIKLYNESNKDQIDQIRIHDFRHSHVSLLINNGVDSFLISKRLGHSKEMVENRYGHLFESRKKEVENVLNKFNL